MRSRWCAIPADLPLDGASLLACGVITGVGAVFNTAQMPPGATVAVIGAGGVGLNTIQGAALGGAARIIADRPAAGKLAAARDFGATHGVAAGPDAASAVRELTDGRGVDFVFVTVGAPAAIAERLALLAAGGAIVVVGMPASGVMVGFEPIAPRRAEPEHPRLPHGPARIAARHAVAGRPLPRRAASSSTS